MPSRNTKSKQLKKRVKNTVYPHEILWPEVSFSTVYLKNMKKIKFLKNVQERVPFLTQIVKIAERGKSVEQTHQGRHVNSHSPDGVDLCQL